MVERVYGNTKETDVVQYGPEDAGQKIGWVTVVPNTETSSYYVTGAYATVGDKGAAVAVAETIDTKERVWSTGLTRGLSRACAYSILVDPERDTRIMNTDYIHVDLQGADQVAGRVFHTKRDIDDARVHWAKGEDELPATMKAALAEQGLESFYPYLYLTVNGRTGRQLYRPNTTVPPELKDIATTQLYDPDMEEVVRGEMRKISAYNLVLDAWADNGEIMVNGLEDGDVDPELFGQFRRKAAGFHRRIEQLRGVMTAPLVSYVPEGVYRTYPYMTAGDFGEEQRAVEAGDFGVAAYAVGHEAEELRQRQIYALEGAYILLALTANGRERIATDF